LKKFKSYLLSTVLFTLTSAYVKADTTDNYQIYIKNILIRTEAHFMAAANDHPFLIFDKANYSDTLKVDFNHCTRGETNRQLKITDLQGNTLLEWNFPDKIIQESMNIPIGQIIGNSLLKRDIYYKLVYYDNQTTQGATLTLFTFGDRAYDK
jgi:hypothetical protein